jgi:hypothetical protein
MDALNILERIYPKDQIFVHNPRFSFNLPVLLVDCVVPKGMGYATKPVPYVTAENYVRILSQASYLLANNVIKNNVIQTDISSEEFLKAMEDFQLYYRNLALTFHERVERGRVFEMELNLRNVRMIHRLQDFIIFTFANKRTVISGEMSFVFVG